jgi:CRISPR-associated protein Cas2
MQLFLMFDLPTKTKKERRIYRRFRKELLQLGFIRIQFSVYTKYADNDRSAGTLKKNVFKLLPKKGNIRILPLTDSQYEKMETYNNNQLEENEHPPDDFIIF